MGEQQKQKMSEKSAYETHVFINGKLGMKEPCGVGNAAPGSHLSLNKIPSSGMGHLPPTCCPREVPKLSPKQRSLLPLSFFCPPELGSKSRPISKESTHFDCWTQRNQPGSKRAAPPGCQCMQCQAVQSRLLGENIHQWLAQLCERCRLQYRPSGQQWHGQQGNQLHSDWI